MGDRSYTTVRAWPWPGENNLPGEALEELAAHGLRGIDQAPQRKLGDGAVHDGDEISGPIFAIVDDEANYGTELYRALITALHDAGLNVYATNGAGGEYDACWEYHPAGRAMIARAMSDSLGVTLISAEELLEDCKAAVPDATDLADVDDAIVGAAAKAALMGPDIPSMVRQVAQ